jgi:hypothetical protein
MSHPSDGIVAVGSNSTCGAPCPRQGAARSFVSELATAESRAAHASADLERPARDLRVGHVQIDPIRAR